MSIATELPESFATVQELVIWLASVRHSGVRAVYREGTTDTEFVYGEGESGIAEDGTNCFNFRRLTKSTSTKMSGLYFPEWFGGAYGCVSVFNLRSTGKLKPKNCAATLIMPKDAEARAYIRQHTMKELRCKYAWLIKQARYLQKSEHALVYVSFVQVYNESQIDLIRTSGDHKDPFRVSARDVLKLEPRKDREVTKIYPMHVIETTDTCARITILPNAFRRDLSDSCTPNPQKNVEAE